MVDLQKPSPVSAEAPEKPPTRLYRLGLSTAKHRVAIAIGSLMAFLAVAFLAAGALDALMLSRFEAPNSESIATAEELESEFDIGSPNLVLLLTANDGTIDDPSTRVNGENIATELGTDPRIGEVGSYWTWDDSPALRSEDGTQALVVAHVPGNVTEVRNDVLPDIKDEFEGQTGDLTVALGGSDELFREAANAARDDFVLAEIIIIPSLFLLLWIYYRRPVASLLTMAVALFSVVGTLAGLRLIANVTEVSTFAANLTLVMGIALGVDYCLFIVNRFREESLKTPHRYDAIGRAVSTAGRTVIFSAVTVAVSLTVLLLFPFPFLQSFAYAGILVPLTATLGAVIFLPAALAIWGNRVLRAKQKTVVDHGRWYGLARRVCQRPVVYGGAAVAFLLLLGSPFLGVNFGTPDERVLPEGADSRVVAEEMRNGFIGEESDVMQVRMASPSEVEVADYALRVSEHPGIAQVDSASGRFVDGHVEPLSDTVTDRFTGSSDTAWLAATPTAEALDDDPYGLVADIRDLEAPFDTSVSGYPADLSDFRSAMLDRLPAVLLALVAVTFLVLFLMTGSVVIPLKAIILNFLSLTIMFGALVWIFQEGNLSGVIGFTPQGSFEPSIPILMACVAYALSMDYEVFLLSRIKEEYDLTGNMRESIALGIQRSAPLVTVAALVLAYTFAVYATGGVVFLQMLGVGLALAVLVDATVIRGLLLPATMQLTGRYNWWAPIPLRRLHERIGISH